MNEKQILSAVAAVAALSVFGASDGTGGFKIGQRMTLRPYVALSYTWDSNIDTGKHGLHGSQWTVNPGLGIDYKGSNWSLSGALWYQHHSYSRYQSELNTASYGESLNFSFNNVNDGRGWNIRLAQKYQTFSQDDDLSKSDGRGMWRDRQQLSFDGSVSRSIRDYLHMGVHGGYYLMDYDNNINKYAPLYGWKRASLGANVGIAVGKNTDFVLSGTFHQAWQDNDKDLYADRREWDSEPRGKNIGSKSRGGSVSAGFSSRATERITYHATAGWSWFDYGEGVDKSGSITYNVSARWRISDTLNLMVHGSSYYQPSEREYGSYLKDYTLGVGLGKSFIRGRLSGTLDLTYRKETHPYTEYSEDDFDEDIITVRVGCNYRIWRYVSAYATGEYQTTETQGGGAHNHEYDYDRWRVTVGMRLAY